MALYDPIPHMDHAAAAERLAIQPWHAINLHGLALYLYALPDDYAHFDMSMFFGDDNVNTQNVRGLHPVSDPAVCGTVACALGHAPRALGLPMPDSSWPEFCLETFGLDFKSEASEFFFGGDWDYYDNSSRGAGQRILYGLRHGVHPSFSKNRLIGYRVQVYIEEDVMPAYQKEHP